VLYMHLIGSCVCGCICGCVCMDLNDICVVEFYCVCVFVWACAFVCVFVHTEHTYSRVGGYV